MLIELQDLKDPAAGGGQADGRGREFAADGKACEVLAVVRQPKA